MQRLYSVPARGARASLFGAPIRLVATALLVGALAAPTLAHSVKNGGLTIDHPWARETAQGQSAGGGFMTITNAGRAAERLVGGSTPVAARVEVHTMSMEGGIMRMRPLKDGLPIPPGGSVALKPGSFHIMFMGLKRPLKRGEMVPVTLDFARAGKVTVQFKVEPVSHGGSHGGH
ncbi:MAG: copper chaperone PCu(A)C [Alphaproteobacteria bacterium]|nr:copper chaperone PCu(A)C [Alphaproteobacteria bacterium]MBU0793175.1 copper chaperone PCu(A)C [Alphaproteobacteria bacterium]MBU0876964.1 copper chaperone PCu(A)C [Alphaproteobacteria bacterium]MBU1771041.1 copper chaperone PCu(A)C [Alphaproteobacteria bacterium]